MHYFKIAVVAVASLVCTSTAARVRKFEKDHTTAPFDIDKHGRDAVVAQLKARAETAEVETVTVTITTIPAYCTTAPQVITSVFPTTSAENSTVTLVATASEVITSEVCAETTASTSSEAPPTSSAAESSSYSEIASSITATVSTSSKAQTSTSAAPSQSSSAAPTSNDADAKHFNGALVAALIALTGNVVFLI
ncbi:hypothetical protein MMC08_006862 [Hypocenomyce scalaris]|nr:hypothetical protein [Hypocenomyce scalaris]